MGRCASKMYARGLNALRGKRNFKKVSIHSWKAKHDGKGNIKV